MQTFACSLPGSNLLFGLPVVMDTNDTTIKEGSKARAHTNNTLVATQNAMTMCV